MTDEADRAAEAYLTEFRKSKQNEHLHPWVAAKVGYRDGIAYARANPGPEVLGLVEALEHYSSAASNSWSGGFQARKALSQWQAARKGKA